MKILFLTFGTKIVASSRTRVYQYLPFFEEDKIDYKVITYRTGFDYYLHSFWLKNLLLRNLIYKGVGLCNLLFSICQILRLISIAKFYDIIFIQKILIPNFVVKFLKKIFKKKIVFDLDDAIYTSLTCYNKKRFDYQIPLYDLVVLENAYTKEYVNEHGNKNTLRITGPIDCKYYYPKNWTDREEVVVGWIGSPPTEKYLDRCKDIFKKLSDTYESLFFELIGAKDINLEGVRFRLKRWNLNTELADLHNFDIGIMPLHDNEEARGKGGYKLLQYEAIGIPCIASPVGINKEIIIDGVNGFLASSEEEWYQKISLLINDKSLRIRLGNAGIKTVKQKYSFEVAYPILKESLLELLPSHGER